MRTLARLLWGSMVLATLGVWLFSGESSSAADGTQPAGVAISEADFKKLVKKSADDCIKALGEKDKKAQAKARTAAVMIAAYAQYADSGASPELRATLRDAALNLAGTIDRGNTAEALKLAEGLASLKPDPKAKLGPMPIMKQAKLPLSLIMRQFNTTTAGGHGIEAHYKLLTGRVKELPAKDMTDNLILTAYQCAFVAEMIKASEADEPKVWAKYCDDLRGQSLELAAACQKKDGPAGFSAVYRVLRICNDCHKKYRE